MGSSNVAYFGLAEEGKIHDTAPDIKDELGGSIW